MNQSISSSGSSWALFGRLESRFWSCIYRLVLCHWGGEGGLAMGRPQEPQTPVLSHRKFMPGYVTGNKLRSFSVSSRTLPTWL